MQLSVIVCTRNRAYAIIGCLNSIVESLTHASPVDAEIVVVDNGSEDSTLAVIKTWTTTCAYPVKILQEPRKGLSRARNCALRETNGELLVWTDDDCRLSREYIGDVLRHDAADTELVLRGGRVELGDSTDLPLCIKTELAPKRWSRKLNSARYESLSHCIVGCNMTMRKDLVARVGLFDECFGAGANIPGGEDTDFIYRVFLANLLIEYVPDMVVFHHHGRKLSSDGNKLLRNYISGAGALYVKYFFKYFNFCRPAYWDLKHAIREIISGKNYFRPEVNFSYKKILVYSALGAMKYVILLVRRKCKDLKI